MSVPAQLGGRATVAHGWRSAALTPYVLSAGRAPAGPDEVVTGYPRRARRAGCALASTEAARTVTVVGVARPRHPVRQQTAIFLTDAEAARLAGHPGTVDAIGVLAGPGFDVSRLRAAAPGAVVLTGDARGRAEYPELQQARTKLIAVTASFGGLALFIAIFVVAGHDGPVDPAARARDRAAASGGRDARSDSPHDRVGGDDRRPGRLSGGNLARDHPRPSARTCARAPRHRAANVLGPRRWAAGRGGHRRRRRGSAARRPGCRTARRAGAADPRPRPTPQSQPRLLGPGRIIGGLLALAGAVPLFAVSTTTRRPDTAAATSELTALFLVVAVGFLGPIVAASAAGRVLGPPLARDLARRRLSGVGEPRHRHAALLVGQHAAGADRRA